MTPSTGISEETKQILVSLGRLEENMKHLSKKMDDFSKVSEIASKTQESVKNAHIRIDETKTDFEKELIKQEKDTDAKLAVHKEQFTELKNDIVWLKRTVIGAFIGGGVSLIFGIAMFFIQK